MLQWWQLVISSYALVKQTQKLTLTYIACMWQARRKLCHFDRDALNLIGHPLQIQQFSRKSGYVTKRHSEGNTLITEHYQHVIIIIAEMGHFYHH